MTLKKIKKLFRSFSVAMGIILIWRGIWYLLDIIDAMYFDGGHIFTAIAGIAAGVLILYIPDHDLDELSKL